MIEVCTGNVHLIDVSHSGDTVLISLTPYGFGLRFNTALSAKNGNSAVKYAERAFYFYGKVNVSGGIDNVDTIALPEASCSSGSNGDTSFLFLFHPVHRSGTVVGFADLVGLTGIEKNSFRCGCFTCINMSHDTNVACIFKRVFSSHIFAPSILINRGIFDKSE
jgi:hypothetical protein